MAIDHRIGTKVIKNLRREEAAATRVDPYPYIGVIKNNLDPTRSGRLSVFVPDLGGDPEVATNWRTVSYASPFMGYTPQKQRERDVPSPENSFDEVPHTYGMWMVPPDIGVEVLVVFVAGDPNRGYWLACVNSHLSHHMLPGLAGSKNVNDEEVDDYQRWLLSRGAKVPVTEFNEYASNSQGSNFLQNPKPIHTPQLKILQTQGLDRDSVRGAISSSSQRETPSQVFGISTPGRPSNNKGSNDPAEDSKYVSAARSGKLDERYYEVKSRKGGHTFVMDDGDVLGNDQLVRLRTANGHQIMMHDTAETLYISHANGNSWIELTKSGSVNVYGKNGIALRSEGTINIHSDTNIIMNADNNIIFRAGNRINIESQTTNILSSRLSIDASNRVEIKAGAFNVDADRNISLDAAQKFIVEAPGGISHASDTCAVVQSVDPVRLNSLPDTSFNTTRGAWINNLGAKLTAVTALPSHEPQFRGFAVEQKDPDEPRREMAETYTGTFDAIKSIGKLPVTLPSDVVLRNQPKAQGPIGPLSEAEVRAFMAAMGAAESGSPTNPNAICPGSGLKLQNGKAGYEAINQCGFVGKYQFGYLALIDAGLVKRSVKSNAALNNPNSWVGTDGKPASIDAFKADTQAQEDAMFRFTEQHYKSLVSNGAITKDMTNGQVGGMLGAAHLLGAGGANTWRKTGVGKDANETTGNQWYAVGKTGVEVLAKNIPGLDAG